MSVTPLDKIPSAIVIAHINIAQRKLAELALNQAQLDLKKKNRVLEDLSFIDSLTQIPNRRHFEQFLDAEWEKSVWSKKPISVAMVDIDFFKKYNDQFGHPAGDECLKKVAKEIRDSLHRPSVLS